MNNKIIAIGADHAGVTLKDTVKLHLERQGIQFIDFGTFTKESCHYPEVADRVCSAVTSGECTLGILVCGTGVGMSIAANKHKGIRAACCSDTFSARLTREHNDSNILCFGERVVGEGLALDLVDNFLGAEFEGGKHALRVKMFMDLEDAK